MRRLFGLLSAEDQPDIFMLAEILRGLGRFDEAIEKLLSIKAEQSEVGLKALERARTGDSSLQDKSLDW